jgi:3',5'-cyclic AMP phosphodiesterase CpdA
MRSMPIIIRTVALVLVLAGACHSSPANTDESELYADDAIFTIAVLPDTQGYSQSHPDIFTAQTAWLARAKERLNLKLVVHLGDLVEGSWIPAQWQSSRAAMSRLDGVVPYIIAPGNHDYGKTWEERNARTRSTHLDTYFPRELFLSMPTFGAFYEEGARVDNSYHTFEHGGQRWLVLALEFGPRWAVLDWADQVLAEHPDHLAIVVTHAYLYSDDTRYDELHAGEQMWSPKSYGIAESEAADGQEIWDALVSRHAGVVAVLCGHTLDDGLGRAVSHGASEVHEILANYQMHDQGGQGYLRVMQFDTLTGRVEVRTYSPWRDAFKRDPDNEFEFEYGSHLPR